METTAVTTEGSLSTLAVTEILGNSKNDSNDLGASLTNTVIHFGFLDYTFFIGLLVISALIGFYYGFLSKHKQNNTEEYILAGKSMSSIPISASLIASHISGTTLLGIPVEVYANGTQYAAFIFSALTLAFALIYIYIPLFYELQLTSSFQYLEKRYDRRVRLMGSLLYTIAYIFFTPIVIYIPALAFSQVTGYNLHLVTPVICVVCVFYTTIGGLRAVVWTDFVQFLLMMGAVFAVIIVGVMAVGSVSDVWTIAERGQRLIFFNLDPSPFVRTSFWTISFGLTISWISGMGVSQGCIQRFLAVPDLKAANRSVWIFVIGLIVIKVCAIFTGLLVYAKYEQCDPVKAGYVQKTDQVLPYYIMDVGSKIPGLPGLFIAGIFAAGLSTMSAVLNTLSGTIFEDFLKPYFPKASEKKISNIMKVIVVILGVIVTALVFVVEKLGPVFQVGVSISGMTAGAMLSIFTIGMISRTANTKGVITGATCSMLLIATILVGAQKYGVTKSTTLPVNTDKCENNILEHLNLNVTTSSAQHVHTNDDDVPWIFRISFMYYSLIGFCTSIGIAYVVSLLTGGMEEFDEMLLTPLFQSKKYKEEKKRNKVKYADIDRALIEMKKQTEE